jgi:DNA-binding beta-propeller fold protein YncE
MKKTLLLLSVALVGSLALQADSGYKVTGRYAIGGTEGWDYISIDSVARRLYVSHGTKVEVLDADSGSRVGVIEDTPGVHGIAIATGMNRGFTSNGKEDKVSIFDAETLKLIEKIDVGKGPDGIFFDAGSKRVFTNNHGSHDITAIDAASGKVVGTIEVKGDGEQMVNGRSGLLWVNLENTNEVVEFDPKGLAVTRRFTIGDAKTPTGLAFDKKNNRLFVAARSKSLVVMDAANGKVVTTLPIGAGVDFAGFDAEARLVFASNGDGTLSVIHQKSADEYEDAGAVTTQKTAKTMAFDLKTKHIFLPTAEVEMIPSAEAGGKPARKVVEGTFAVLVVGK